MRTPELHSGSDAGPANKTKDDTILTVYQAHEQIRGAAGRVGGDVGLTRALADCLRLKRTQPRKTRKLWHTCDTNDTAGSIHHPDRFGSFWRGCMYVRIYVCVCVCVKIRSGEGRCLVPAAVL